MVDQGLRTLTNEFTGLVTGFEVVPLAQAGIGLGTGFFSAEFFAQLIGGMVSDRGRIVRFAVEILSKLGVTGAGLILRRVVSGQLWMVLAGLVAVGASLSTIFQVLEAIAETAARIATGELGALEQGSHQDETQSESTTVDSSGYGNDAGGQTADATV